MTVRGTAVPTPLCTSTARAILENNQMPVVSTGEHTGQGCHSDEGRGHVSNKTLWGSTPKAFDHAYSCLRTWDNILY